MDSGIETAGVKPATGATGAKRDCMRGALGGRGGERGHGGGLVDGRGCMRVKEFRMKRGDEYGD